MVQIETMKYVVLPASQSYGSIITAIHAQRGYPNERGGTLRYATDDLEQWKATDGKYYVPIWYDLQDLPIFDGLTLVKRSAFKHASELLHPMWTANEVVKIGDVRWDNEVYYEAKTNHTCKANTRPPNATNWKLWEQ